MCTGIGIGLLATSLIGTGASIIQGRQAQAAAEEAAEQEAKARGFANAEAKRQYDQEQLMFKPVKERLIKEGMSDTPTDYAKYRDVINQQYGALEREQLNSPIANSGLAASQITSAKMEKASKLAQAFTDAKERQKSSLMNLLGYDQSARTGQNYLSALGSDADFYGRNAAMLGQSARENYAQGIKGMGSIVDAYARKDLTPDAYLSQLNKTK